MSGELKYFSTVDIQTNGNIISENETKRMETQNLKNLKRKFREKLEKQIGQNLQITGSVEYFRSNRSSGRDQRNHSLQVG